MTGKEGYFLAKREALDSLRGRMEILAKKIDDAKASADWFARNEYEIEYNVLEKVKTHLRNSLLWNTEND